MPMLERSNIQRLYLRITEQVKDFLLSERSREFFLFLFFFLIAGVFWLIETLNSDYETKLTMPVRLVDVPDNVVITSEPVSEIRIAVKDRGTVLLNYKLWRGIRPLSLRFNDYKSNGGHVRIAASEYEKQVQSLLDVSTRLLSVSPDTLEYIYATGASKRVPVRLLGKATAGREYYLTDTIFRPDSVLVYAPHHRLDTITAIYTQPLLLENVADTLTCEAPLQVQKGVKVVPDVAQLTLATDIYTEKTVEVPLVGINFPKDKVLRAFPSKVSVTFQIGVSRFRQVNAGDFQILVNYEDLLHRGAEKYPVTLTTYPKGVKQIRIHPEEVDFLIEQL